MSQSPDVSTGTAGPGSAAITATAPETRVAVEVPDRWRILAGVIGVLAVVFGGVLAWRNIDGVSVASCFALGTITLVFSLMGVVPASVKLGDVDIKLLQAREQGMKAGAAAGITTVTAAAQAVAAGDMTATQAKQAVKTTLTTPESVVAPLDVTAPDLGELGEELADHVYAHVLVPAESAAPAVEEPAPSEHPAARGDGSE